MNEWTDDLLQLTPDAVIWLLTWISSGCLEQGGLLGAGSLCWACPVSYLFWSDVSKANRIPELYSDPNFGFSSTSGLEATGS